MFSLILDYRIKPRRNTMNKTIILTVMLMMLTAGLFANNYGASAAQEGDNFTLEEMLLYALQDEHLALAEYEAIMDNFNVTRPYSNIANAEKTHIGYVEELYNELGWDIPRVETKGHVILPASLEEAARIGVQAELDNIAMYEKFLAGDLPENVREVFIDLKESSEKHLSSFQRQLDQGSFGQGKARTELGEDFEGRGRNRTDDHHHE
jgi:rubrerythrin